MRRRFVLALLAGAALVLNGQPAVLEWSPAAAAGAGAPAEWASACSSEALGLDDVVVQHAPVLRDDREAGGRGASVVSEPDARGRWVPVVMVHGWVGRSTHTQGREGAFSGRIDLTSNALGTARGDRSLIGQLQGVPGAAVFTYDYSAYGARWVTDPHLGPGLGEVVDCLYRASGQRVVLVGHSMGGLVSRYAAAAPGLDGARDRSAQISSAITFGTPGTGSIAALATAVGLDAASVSSRDLAVLRLVLAQCGELASHQVRTGTLCDGLPAPARAFASDAGIALRAGSRELAALRPWPAPVYVDALAGDTLLTVPASAGWFRSAWDTTDVSGLGDLIVTKGSALHQADDTKVVSCRYQLNAVRAGTDRIGLALGQTSRADVAGTPLGAASGPCFHTSLMRGIELTNDALAVVSADIAARQPVQESDLLTAPVPASCQHPAGRLTDGRLLGLPEGTGTMELAHLSAPERKQDLLRLADFDGNGSGDALVVLSCNAGGVSWPNIVAYYVRSGDAMSRATVSLRAWSYVSDLHSAGGEDRSRIASMTAAGAGTVITYDSGQEGDAACCSTAVVTATITLSGGDVAVSDVAVADERPTARRFFTALADDAALDPDDVGPNTAERVRSGVADDEDGPLVKAAARGDITCTGVLSLYGAEELLAPLDGDAVERVCYVRAPSRAYAGIGNAYALIGLTRSGESGGDWLVTTFSYGYLDPYFEPGFDPDTEVGD